MFVCFQLCKVSNYHSRPFFKKLYKLFTTNIKKEGCRKQEIQRREKANEFHGGQWGEASEGSQSRLEGSSSCPLLLDHTVRLKICFAKAREWTKEEKAMRSRTHRPLTQEKGKGHFKDDSKVKAQDENWMAERTASPDWRKVKVSRRDTSREKQLEMAGYLLGLTYGRVCCGKKMPWVQRKWSRWKQQNNY